MTCRRTREDRTQVVTLGQHADPLPDDHDTACKGCATCDRRHCTVCTTHLQTNELQTCTECTGQVRRDLIAIFECAALLPDHALNAGHDGRLVAALELPGGDALVMLARGSEGLADDDDTARADEPSPPSFVLAWWAEKWRDRLGLDSQLPAWQRRADRMLVESFEFLDHHHTWAAAHHPGFHAYARDLKTLRSHLEQLLNAGENPGQGAPCFECDTTLVRDYYPPTRCSCGPRPRGGHITTHSRTDVCCLGCAALMRWELAHAGHDQGGLVDPDPNAGWYCPRCGRTYTAGEYERAVATDYDYVAEYRRLDDAARLTGAKPGTIRVWATRGRVHRRRDTSGRTTYRLADIEERLAEGHTSRGA